ncbi:I-Tevl homing endonuclease [Salmonella phage STP4-a]|uniref:I-Tevl homing endonuclease n=1 Tax=Salmonella phage STP4-a TaxID=1445860 RepID=A0A0B4L9Z2_9CAUD|nr:homing endonuclease [Salmonella phage STP4-a]AHJ86818.1 I-Tevl homing endonuclease [Salmonella phage STP4-a]
MKSGIYQIKNVLNNKIYVGSAKDFDKRWKRHFSDLSNNAHHSIKLQRSYNKHGNVFECSVLEEVPYEKDIIIERENFWIKTLNSKQNGYNIADASFGDVFTNHPLKKEIIKKRAATVKAKMEKLGIDGRKVIYGKPGELNGRWNPEKHKFCKCGKRISPAFKTCSNCRDRSGQSNPFFGKEHSKETREILSNKAKGRKPSNIKKISCDGIIFECAADAARHFEISSGLVTYRVKSDKWNWFYC